MEDPYKEKYRDIIISWVGRNLYKMVTVVMAAGFYIGLKDGAATGNISEVAVSCVFGLLCIFGLALWIEELRESKIA